MEEENLVDSTEPDPSGEHLSGCGRSLPNAADCAKSTELERIVRIRLFKRLKNEALFRWLKEGQAATCLLEIAL